MAILVTAETKVMCQGLTGRAATFHCGRMLSYGTQLVAGVVPGKEGARTSTCRSTTKWRKPGKQQAQVPAWCSYRPSMRQRQ